MVSGELFMLYLRRIWLYIEYWILTLQVMWYQSEIEYLDRRIAKLERELVVPENQDVRGE